MKTLKLLCHLARNEFIFIYKYLITHYMTDDDNISTLLRHLNELSQESYSAHDMNPLEHTGGLMSWLRGDKNKIANDTEKTKQTTTSVTDDTPDGEIIRLNLRIEQKDEEIAKLKSYIEGSADHYKDMETLKNKLIQDLTESLEIRNRTYKTLSNKVFREGTEWKDNNEIACIIFLTPDSKHVWIFKFEKDDNDKYPSNNNSDAKCSVEIRPTDGLKTLREMLQKFKMGNYSDFYEMLNYAGYNIDDKIDKKGLETVMLKRRKEDRAVLAGV